MATRTGGQTYYLLADHLTSTAVTTNSAGARLTELRYYPYGAARYNPGSQLTTYRFTGQRWDSGTALYFYGARWYDPAIGRFLSADTIVPEPGDPQSLNRYTYVSNNPLKFIDPTGHDGCAAEDRACWEDRWYKEHGYENDGSRYVYTGNYVFVDPEAARELISDVAAGRHRVAQSASFTFDLGRFTIGLERRGRDTLGTEILGVLGLAADIVDFGITAGFAGAYSLEQSAAAATGVGAPIGFAVGEVAYLGVQGGLFIVDAAGWLSVATADFFSGRTSFDLSGHEMAIGLDTLASSASWGFSNLSLSVVPGVYMGLTGDVGQLTYDYLRFSGRLQAYSLVVKW